jgi:hypothetical protein
MSYYCEGDGEFTIIIKRKGWTPYTVGERWGISVDQVLELSKSGNKQYIDMANGLPNFER